MPRPPRPLRAAASRVDRQTDKAEGAERGRERGGRESARVESGFSPVPAGREEGKEEGLC